MPQKIKSVAATASTNSYATLITVNPKDLQEFSKITFLIKEENVNAIEYQLLASKDGTNYDFTIKSTTDIAKDGEDYEVVADPLPYLALQIRSDVADTAGSVSCEVWGGF